MEKNSINNSKFSSKQKMNHTKNFINQNKKNKIKNLDKLSIKLVNQNGHI